ncbi:MAG: family 43 glycosylhydrolase [Prolixibacteraceae bacterium]|nr:family 43 glycosylhydrolase [Prolixibacteraceae bacterium]
MKLYIVFLLIIFSNLAIAQNPIIHNQFTADPTARVFNGKMYLFPSHDIIAPEGANLRKDWFCMGDYHVFSSENLTAWTDHGVIVDQKNVDWVDSNSYSMWAPDCVERNEKYYFYFPANTKHVNADGRKSFGIGVAIADKPEGPYTAQVEPIKGVLGIDPNVFIDRDGQAYLLWSMGKIFIAKLNANMLELASEPIEIKNLPEKGLKEGPFMFERNGIYYLTYPHVENTIERLEYAISDSPTGNFKVTGVIMDESPTGCWTNHQSVVNFKNQWYLFYHHNDFSPKFDKNRSACIDSLFFNADGTIRKVKPTLRGVGITQASDKIQIDRYSLMSENGISVTYIDTLNYFAGWKTIFKEKGVKIQYNAVNFENDGYTWVNVRAMSDKGGELSLSFDNINSKTSTKIKIPVSKEWKTTRVKILKPKKGVHNVIVTNVKNQTVEVDWISFE